MAGHVRLLHEALHCGPMVCHPRHGALLRHGRLHAREAPDARGAAVTLHLRVHVGLPVGRVPVPVEWFQCHLSVRGRLLRHRPRLELHRQLHGEGRCATCGTPGPTRTAARLSHRAGLASDCSRLESIS
eukprot:4066438-Prymnesium_polylepis.2